MLPSHGPLTTVFLISTPQPGVVHWLPHANTSALCFAIHLDYTSLQSPCSTSLITKSLHYLYPRNLLSMSSSTGEPKHPVWDVFGYFLGNQFHQACSLSKPTIDMNDDDLEDILHQLIVNLAHGGSQKEIYTTLAPYLESPQQQAVFSELCSSIFSTQGVLTSLYQPLLSQDNLLKMGPNTNERKYCAQPLGLDLTDNLRLSRLESKWTWPDVHPEFALVPSAERATGQCPLESASSRHQ